MPNPTFLGLVKFGAGEGCPCGGTLQGWRKVRAYKAQHGWPVFDSGEFVAYLRQDISGEGGGGYAGTRVIDSQTGLSDGRPLIYIPGSGSRFPAPGYYVMEASTAVQPWGVERRPFGGLERTGQIELSVPYSFGSLKEDLSAILFSAEANPISRPAGSVTLAARAEVSAEIGTARIADGSMSPVAIAPTSRFRGEPDCRIVRWEPPPPGISDDIDGHIYVHPTGIQWDSESQAPASRTYRLRTQYLRSAVSRMGFYSRERGLLSFGGFYSRQDVLASYGLGDTVLFDSGKSYYRHSGPYLDISSPEIPDHFEGPELLRFIRTIRLGDLPPGGVPYQDTRWTGGAGAGAGGAARC